MARIPVEENKGSSWWKWLIPLLLIGAVAIWALDEATEPPYDDAEEEVAAVGVFEEGSEAYSDVVYEAPDNQYTAADAAPVAFATLVSNSDELEGQLVALSNIQARSIVGDSTFYVHPDGEMDRILVVLAGMGESETGANGSDGRFNVDSGETFRIVGRIQPLNEADHDEFGLTDAQWNNLSQDDWYVRAVRMERLDG